MSELNLPDIPDLSGINESSASSDPLQDGWYQGTIVESRTITDQIGNERTFASSDEPSQRGDSRNIRLQVELTRKSDGRKVNLSYLLNYRPEDIAPETVQQVTTHLEKAKAGEEWGPLFRSFMTLQRLSKLQKIAGVKQLQRNGNGGLDLKPLYNKSGWFKLTPDDRNPAYKQVKDIRDTAPKAVL